jgi:hypothetical protein
MEQTTPQTDPVAELEAAGAAVETGLDRVEQAVADVAEPVETAESVEAWLDAAIGELTGALEAAGRLVEAGELDPNVPTLKLQALVARMMGG